MEKDDKDFDFGFAFWLHTFLILIFKHFGCRDVMLVKFGDYTTGAEFDVERIERKGKRILNHRGASGSRCPDRTSFNLYLVSLS